MNKIDWVDKKNLTMLADFYEFTMGNGYIQNGIEEKYAYFSSIPFCI
jgi:nicotinate phosphoribosyltransferase